MAEKLPDAQWGIDWGEMAKKAKCDHIPLMHRHQYAAFNNKGLGAFYHRKERIKMMWPDYAWHRWNERRLHGLCDYRWVTWMAGGGCVAGWTRIFNPITGENPTIQELHERKEAPFVMTLYGAEKAEIPFIKGHEELYEVKLENGDVFTTTGKHRVLTSSGYVFVESLRIGDSLASYVPCPQVYGKRSESDAYRQPSILELVPSTHALDALHSRKKVEGFQENYSVCFCPDGERLPLTKETFRESFPSLVGVPKYNACASLHSDDSDNKPHGIHPYSRSLLPSIDDFSRRYYNSKIPSSLHSCEETSGSLTSFQKSQFALPFHSTNNLLRTSPEEDHDNIHTDLFCNSEHRKRMEFSYNLRVSESRVYAIKKTHSQIYYDITVPVAHHYFAEGAIHHNTGKSTDGAVFGLEYWLQAPDRTAVIVCSTTMKMLRARIWSEVVKYHSKLPKNVGGVGDLLDSVTRIRWKQGDDKNGIFGMAVEEGNVEEIINNLIGIHTQRVMLILDEAQGVREAIMGATKNMSKNPRFDALLMGNPDGLMNPLGRESEPLGGWDSVTRGETEQWETLGGPTAGNGLCQFFDGRKSPANDSPEEKKRLSFLMNEDWVANHLKSVHGNWNDPSVWSQVIGWPPPMGLESTLLDDSIIQTFKCRDKPVWTDGFTRAAALDAAFGGGDSAILQFFRYGQVTDEDGKRRWLIGFDEWLKVPISSESSQPIHYQIMEYCRVECEKRRILYSEFSLDASGEGGGLKAIFDREWGVVNGIEAGGSPSDLPIDDSGKTAREAYDTRASELCFSLREFALSNGVRGLSEEASKQACARRTFYRNGKWAVEPKTGSKGRTDERGRPVRGFRQRMGYSPDEMDAVNIAVEHARQRGAVPALIGAAIQAEQSRPQERDEFSDEGNYLEGYSYA